MAIVLRQSTQIIVRIGSFMDATDGVTPETGITLGAADQAEAMKAGGGASVDISGNTWAAVTGAGGWYDLTLTTTDTNTVGDLTIIVQDTSVCLPVEKHFQVMEEAVYDRLYAASAAGFAVPGDAVNVTQISGDTAAADALETMLDGTGGNVLTLSQLRINSAAAGGGIDIDNSAGPAISARTSSGDAVEAVSTGGNGDGIAAAGNGTGQGIRADGGATGHGIRAAGGATSGNGLVATAPAGFGVEITAPNTTVGLYIEAGIGASINATAGSGGNALELFAGAGANGLLARGGDSGGAGIYANVSNQGHGILAEGNGTGFAGLRCTGGASAAAGIEAIGSTTGHGIVAQGGVTGHGIHAEGGATSGHGINAEAPTLGDGIHAASITAGDGIEAVGAGGGFDINADIQGSLSGSVASVTGNVGGNVVGNVNGNLGGTLSAAALAQINTEADTALADVRLDELIQNAASPATPTINSFWDRATSKDGSQTYDRSTDSLEAIRDNLGGGGLTQQNVRDAMKLAPTAGAPAAGSVDEHLDDILADTAAMQPTIATNLDATVSSRASAANLALVQADTTAILADTSVIEPLVSTNLDATVSSRATPAQVNSEVDTALGDIRLDELIQNAASPVEPTIDSFLDRITSKDAGQTYDRSTDSLEAVKDAIGGGGLTQQQVRDAMKLAPTAGAPAAGSVDLHLDEIEADTAAMQPLVDVAISTRASAANLALVQADTTAILADTSAIEPLVTANLDATISSRAAPGDAMDLVTDAVDSNSVAATGANEIALEVDVVLSGTHGAGAWGGGGGLSAQNVRDAMKLAPTAGAPAAGSVDEHLDDILADTSVIEPLVSANLDAPISAVPTAQENTDDLLDELLAGHLDPGSVGEAINNAAAGGAGLTPQQVADAMNLAPGGVAAAGSVNGNLDLVMGPGFNSATDSLEEIRDEVDACCGTGGGPGDDVDVEAG